MHRRTKNIDIRHHYILECVERGDVELRWIGGKENIADALTKELPRPSFEKCKAKMGT
jgi:hypothetical protein